MSVVADSVNISGQSNAVQFKVPECRLSDDFGSLFDSQKFSDVTLSVCGREFQVIVRFVFVFFFTNVRKTAEAADAIHWRTRREEF